MWKDLAINGPGVVALECEGRFSKGDFEEMHTWIDRQVAQQDCPALVLFMGKFEGYESPSALWADMRIDERHARDFSRVALVADQWWLELATKAGNTLTCTELRFFGPDQRGEAIAWARDGTGDARAPD